MPLGTSARSTVKVTAATGAAKQKVIQAHEHDHPSPKDATKKAVADAEFKATQVERQEVLDATKEALSGKPGQESKKVAHEASKRLEGKGKP